MRNQQLHRTISSFAVIVLSVILIGCPENEDMIVPPVPVPVALTLNTAGAGSGTVVASPAAATYLPGTQVTLTATAATGSAFTGWGGACSVRATTCTITMDFAKSVTGTFVSATGAGQYDGAYTGGFTGGTSD